MTAITRRRLGAVSAAGALGLALAACGGSDSSPSGSSDGGEAGNGGTLEVEDNNGVQSVVVPPQSVVATDNRTFQTLEDWGVTLSAAARALMHTDSAYKEDDAIVDLGNHREPDLEAVVAVQPDLIINGQRFASFHDDFVRLAPEAVVLELDPREDELLDAELKRQVEVLGQIFQKETEAEALSADLDAAVERVKAAYVAGESVMGVIVSGGEIGYSAPTTGRTLGPLFDVFDFTPALEIDGASEFDQGDDISVEAIAEANPDWILVMDRDAGFTQEESQPAAEVIEQSEALASVTAVSEGNVIYMPDDTYLNEGIQTYTTFIGQIADAFEARS